MFGFFKSKKGDVLSHWYSAVDDFNISTKDFYAGIEEELNRRKIPGLEISRVDFSEGGILSADRVYLRMERERLVFDVCAAPFGTSYFFSVRFAELPSMLNIWEWIAFLIGSCFVLSLMQGLLSGIFGWMIGSILLLPAIILIILFLRNIGKLGLKQLDIFLYSLPVIGAVYEKFFRRETYYRQDTRLMFLEIINAVVRHKIAEVTAEKGVQLLAVRQYAPLLDDLYRPIRLNGEPPHSSPDTSALSIGV